MSYRVKDYMTRDVNTIDLDTTVVEVAEVMAADPTYGGYVLVLKQGKPAGIVTERDIVNNVVAKKLDPSTTKTSEVTSTPLITVDPDEDLMKASEIMRKHNVNKLPVVRDGIIYGIITSRDIANQCGAYVDRSIKDIIRWTAPFGI